MKINYDRSSVNHLVLYENIETRLKLRKFMKEKDKQNMANAYVIIMLEVQKLFLKKFYSNPFEWKPF